MATNRHGPPLLRYRQVIKADPDLQRWNSYPFVIKGLVYLVISLL